MKQKIFSSLSFTSAILSAAVLLAAFTGSASQMSEDEVVNAIYDACAVGGCNAEQRVWEYFHPGQSWPGQQAQRPRTPPRRPRRLTDQEKDAIYDACAVGGCDAEAIIRQREGGY